MPGLERWEEIRPRLEGYWNHEVVDRCCVSITAPRAGAPGKAGGFAPQTDEEWQKWYMDGEILLNRWRAQNERTVYLGDALPCVFPNFGTAGQTQYVPGNKCKFSRDTVWFEASVEDWADQHSFFDEHHPLYRQEIETLSYLCEHLQGQAMVAFPDNCGILDGLAHLRGSERLLLDMVERPEVLDDMVERAIKAYFQSAEVLFGLIEKADMGGSMHAWMHTWCPGRHAQMQADCSVMISPDMYERFVMPELRALTHWLDHSIYHLDGREQIRHLDLLLSLDELDAIQWTPVAGQPRTSEFIPVFQRIQRAGKGLVLIPQMDEIEPLLDALSPEALMLVVNAPDEESGREVLRLVERKTGRG